MSRVLKKRNFNFAEVDANKIERLSNDDILNIKLDEILLCLTDRDLINKGLLKNGKLKANNQQDAIITIQKFFRMYFIRKKYHEEIFQHNKILHIQKFYRNIKLKIISSKLVLQKYHFSYFKWCTLMEEFKRNWTNTKQQPRIEIHINSKSFNSHTQSDTNFPRVDNFQLERMIRLVDPNVSMIIVCPFKVDEEIIEMYFSFLAKHNVKNAHERVTFIVPVKFAINLRKLPNISATKYHCRNYCIYLYVI
jgi:hypothetical protein